MYEQFVFDKFVHRIPYGPNSLFVEEITHIDEASVDKLTIEIRILHQVTEKHGGLFSVGPFPIPVVSVVEIIEPLDGIELHFFSIEP